MLPIKAVSFGTLKASLSRAAHRSSQTDAKRRFRRAGRLAAAVVGTMVLALVGASAASALLLAYVSNATKDLVLPINLTTQLFEAPISTKGILTSSIAITSSGALAYAPSLEGETLLPINLTTKKTEAGIALPEKKGKIEPEAIAITPNGELAYVVDEEFNKSEGAISVVLVSTNKVVATIKVGEEPEGIAFTSDGELAWVTNKATEKLATITVIEKASTTPKVKTTINIGNSTGCLPEGKNPAGACVEPEKIAISGELAYVAEAAAGIVEVFRIATQKEVAEISVGEALVSNQEPDNIAVNPSGSLAYAVDNLTGKVKAIEIKAKPSEDKVVATIAVGKGPSGLAFTANGELAVVVDEEEENVKTIEATGSKVNKVAATFLVLGEPDGVAITP